VRSQRWGHRLIPRIQDPRTLVEAIRRCLESPHQFLVGIRAWRALFLLSAAAFEGRLQPFSCGLQVLRRNSHNCSLPPGHQMAAPALNVMNRAFCRPAGNREQAKTFVGAILARWCPGRRRRGFVESFPYPVQNCTVNRKPWA
jgi:hypothetical protein